MTACLDGGGTEQDMVMGPTHAMSGALAGVVGAPMVAHAMGHQMGVVPTLIAAGVTAGAALLPDLDCPTSTIAHTLGPITWVLSKATNAFSYGFYTLTKSRHDPDRDGGHRTLTHTFLGAATVGFLVSLLCGIYGKWAVASVLAFMLCLALRGVAADWAKKQGWLVTTATAIGLTALAIWKFPTTVTHAHVSGAHSAIHVATANTAAGNWWWLGIAVGAGMVIHDLGDAITKAGVPLLAPIPLFGRRWREFTTGPLAIRAGGGFEYAVLVPVFTIGTFIAVINLLDPGFVTQLWHHTAGSNNAK